MHGLLFFVSILVDFLLVLSSLFARLLGCLQVAVCSGALSFSITYSLVTLSTFTVCVYFFFRWLSLVWLCGKFFSSDRTTSGGFLKEVMLLWSSVLKWFWRSVLRKTRYLGLIKRLVQWASHLPLTEIFMNGLETLLHLCLQWRCCPSVGSLVLLMWHRDRLQGISGPTIVKFSSHCCPLGIVKYWPGFSHMDKAPTPPLVLSSFCISFFHQLRV